MQIFLNYAFLKEFTTLIISVDFNISVIVSCDNAVPETDEFSNLWVKGMFLKFCLCDLKCTLTKERQIVIQSLKSQQGKLEAMKEILKIILYAA